MSKSSHTPKTPQSEAATSKPSLPGVSPEQSASNAASKAPARTKLTHVPDGAQFLVRLDPLECAKKILIPGHRFEPFHSPKISIPRLELQLPDLSFLPKKNIIIPYNEIIRFHYLLSLMDTFFMLEEMHPENLPADMSDASNAFDRLIRLSVFDLEPLFPNPIREGTYLRLSVQKYQKGVFSVVPISPEEASQLDREAWFSAMDAAFLKAFDELKFPRRNDVLLTRVYLLGGEALYRDPAASLIDYLNAKREAEIISFGGENLIWKKGIKPEEIVLTGLEPYGTGSRKPRKTASAQTRSTSTETEQAALASSSSPSTLSPPSSASSTSRKGRKLSLKTRLNRFFDEYEFAFNADEIKALMLDMAYRGTTLQQLWDRFFESSPQWTVFPEAANELIDLIEDYCDEVLANYDPTHDDLGEMRAFLVDIYAHYIAWMRRLDTKLRSPEDLPIEKFKELATLIGSLNEFMIFMNTPGKSEPTTSADIEQFFASADIIRQTITELEHEIEQEV